MNKICLLGSYNDKEIQEACENYDLVYYIDDFEFTNYNLFSREKLNQYNNLVIYKDFPSIVNVIDEYEPNLRFNRINIAEDICKKYPKEIKDFMLKKTVSVEESFE